MQLHEKDKLGNMALRAALQVRNKLKLPTPSPICVYDIALSLGIRVRFCDIDSLGGVFASAENAVLLPARRPPGRLCFTCAHEIGHWYFGHGDRLDSQDDVESGRRGDVKEEFLANVFAGFLLMPRNAVSDAFQRRGWGYTGVSPFQVMGIACQLGVGYSSLIQHMCWSIGLLPEQEKDRLLRSTPKSIRSDLGLLGETPRLVPVDRHWHTVPVDLRVGDLAILPCGSEVNGACLEIVRDHDQGRIMKARRVGLGEIVFPTDDWSAAVRVCRADYKGLAQYRHLEDPDDDV